EENPVPPPSAASTCIPVPGAFLDALGPGDRIILRDARKSQRILRVSHANGRSRWTEARQTIYFVPALSLRKITHTKTGEQVVHEETRIGNIPPVPQPLLLKPGDTLIVTR